MTRLRSAQLDELDLPLKEPFATSFGTERRRRFLVLRLTGRSGETGWGECVAARDPLYSSESVETARWVIRRFLLPALFRAVSPEPVTLERVLPRIAGHRMARATVEMALWDLVARERGWSLARLLGGRRRKVEVGVSVGLAKETTRLLRSVDRYVEQGYRRVKLKVQPGWDAAPVAAVRRNHPTLRLWVDANQAYPARAAGAIARWAVRWEVEQVEQPFPERALRAHARLQRGRPFRVCLDESIVDRPGLDDAIEARALRSLNVKPGRVGGHAAALELGRHAAAAGVLPWVGGMLESGIGRAHNLALASSALFRLPPDLSASARYYREDLVEPEFSLDRAGCLSVPQGPGLGVEVRAAAYRRAVRRTSRYTG